MRRVWEEAESRQCFTDVNTSRDITEDTSCSNEHQQPAFDFFSFNCAIGEAPVCDKSDVVSTSGVSSSCHKPVSAIRDSVPSQYMARCTVDSTATPITRKLTRRVGGRSSDPSYSHAPRGRKYDSGNKRSRGFSDDEGESDCGVRSAFKTAKQQLTINHLKSRGYTSEQANHVATSKSDPNNENRRSVGLRRGFVPPLNNPQKRAIGSSNSHADLAVEIDGDERLKQIEPRMVELIRSEIMDHGPAVDWDDIAGLQFAKNTVKEIVIWPLLRPDIFTGLRGPSKGLLLFGPPGTGKTLIGKCIANMSQSTFFSISASSLTSKWVGEGEKMVRALFTVARCHQPSVIFIDEIDSLLSQRSDNEHESSRRIKTEFLVQLDGASTGGEERVVVVAATNRPQELDEAARRRLVQRLYIPLPDSDGRRQICERLMLRQRHLLDSTQLDHVALRSAGFSGADMASLCREAALGPIRCISTEQIQNISPEQLRPVAYEDFEAALSTIRPSVAADDLEIYREWNDKYGTCCRGSNV